MDLPRDPRGEILGEDRYRSYGTASSAAMALGLRSHDRGVRVHDVVRRAREAVTAPTVDPARFGLERLSGGMTHDVFATEDEPSLVVKVFSEFNRSEPEREWRALVSLAGSGIAPGPVRFDPGERPVVVMERVGGSSLAADAFDATHAAAIGGSHRLVHRTSGEPPREAPSSGLQATRVALGQEHGESAGQQSDPADVVGQAWRAAQAWFADFDLDRLVSPERLRFSRGDPNLSNYLWTDEGLVLIDWENSGHSDPALELADMAEHASTRVLSDDFWDLVADATELTTSDRARFSQGRRVMACFWLVLIESRHRQGLPTTVTLEEQAKRTLNILDP
jgi:aminoglycoside phosphotransferase (APT) family kinase protein